jgi:hypothetical protein
MPVDRCASRTLHEDAAGFAYWQGTGSLAVLVHWYV